MGLPEKYKKYDSMTEREYKNHILKELSKYFVILEEYNGVHLCGDNVRIDAVMRPIDNSKWLNKRIVFGIEFKSPRV